MSGGNDRGSSSWRLRKYCSGSSSEDAASLRVFLGRFFFIARLGLPGIAREDTLSSALCLELSAATFGLCGQLPSATNLAIALLQSPGVPTAAKRCCHVFSQSLKLPSVKAGKHACAWQLWVDGIYIVDDGDLLPL